MLRITKHFYIHILILPLLLLSWRMGSLSTFFICYGVVLIHELCHLIAALFLDVKVYSVIVLPFGMTVRMDSSVIRTPKKEALIALAGPLSNGVMLTVSLFAGLASDTLNTALFAVINFAMLILNLLPVPPLDGGRILRAIIMSYTGLIPAGRLMRRISFFFIAVILIVGIFLLIFFRGNPSLIMISAFLLYSFFDETKNSDILVMHEISHEKEKLSTSSFIPTKVLCIHADTPAKKILKKINLSTFFIIHIIDDNMHILRTVTERDFLRGLAKKGYNICAKDIF